MTTRRQALRQLALLAAPAGLPLASGADAPKRIGILSESSAEVGKDSLNWEPDIWELMAQRGQTQALTAGGFPSYLARREVAQFALRQRWPSAFPVGEFVQAGGLLSFAVSDSEVQLLTRRWIEYIDRVLRGANPADMPVIEADRYDLQINMKTAETLGLTIPQSILSRADALVR
jgi:putative ABC transport system substrate-binding protein